MKKNMLYINVISIFIFIGSIHISCCLANSQRMPNRIVEATSFDIESHPGNEMNIKKEAIRNMPNAPAYLTQEELNKTHIGHLFPGSWVCYQNFDFQSGVTSVEMEASLGFSYIKSHVQFRLNHPNGQLISRVDIPYTGNFYTFEKTSSPINVPVSGVHDLYIVIQEEQGQGHVGCLRSFTFHSETSADHSETSSEANNFSDDTDIEETVDLDEVVYGETQHKAPTNTKLIIGISLLLIILIIPVIIIIIKRR